MSELPNAKCWGIPKAWAWVEFSDAVQIASNLVKPEEISELPHIAPDNIEGGTARLLPFNTIGDDGVISSKHHFFPGQIIYSKIRPYLRKAVLVDFEGGCSADMYPLAVSEKIDPRFLLHWLISDDFSQFVVEHQGRTVLPKINQKALNQTPLPLPPLAEQKRIVAKLDSLSARSARARKDIARIAPLVKRYKQAVLSKAFSGELTKDWRIAQAIPTGPLTALADLCISITDGDHQAPPKATDGVPFITISAMNEGTINLSKATRFVPSSYYEALQDSRRAQVGDVLYSVTGSYGIPAVVDFDLPFVFQRHIAVLRPNQGKLETTYLSYMLASPQVKSAADAVATGTAQKTVPLKGLRQFSVPAPSLAEQKEIVRRIESAFQKIDKLAAEAKRALELTDKLDEAILAKAFRGELVPQDPNDEPANVLLDRIKAERAAAPKAKRGRGKKN